MLEVTTVGTQLNINCIFIWLVYNYISFNSIKIQNLIALHTFAMDIEIYRLNYKSLICAKCN